MSLRGLDDWITGHYGEDYWQGDRSGEDDRENYPFVCYTCAVERACSLCTNKRCQCANKTGRKAKTHGPYDGPVKLVIDNPGASLNDGKKD